MREYTATVTVDGQSRITIPKAIRDNEKLKPGDVLEVVIRIREELAIKNEQGNREASVFA